MKLTKKTIALGALTSVVAVAAPVATVVSCGKKTTTTTKKHVAKKTTTTAAVKTVTNAQIDTALKAVTWKPGTTKFDAALKGLFKTEFDKILGAGSYTLKFESPAGTPIAADAKVAANTFIKITIIATAGHKFKFDNGKDDTTYVQFTLTP